ncbi:MetQ/NlpA family ABC transporter substrate-binding protein [Enterococcus faecalis]|uniref:MetQ/NlpA family ABC transporter substrate-binding protein n=1 Tax=Enterococcus faecalis TaxID=1351 RepID=UPI003A97A6EB
MKKRTLWSVITVAVAVLVLGACGNKKSDDSVLKVGASPVPHAEILEHVKPLLEKEGVKLEVTTYTDYVLPNKALESGDIDANYFQHVPFFNEAVKENDYDFVNAGAIHLEPVGLYSKKYKSLQEIPDGSTIYVSSSVSDWPRVLTILEDAGLITLKEGVDRTTATFDDIDKNTKKLKFNHESDPAIMTTLYDNEEGVAVLINSNFAVDQGLNPKKDAIALEKESSPYANIIAVRKEDENNENVKKLVKVLRSKEVQDWITKKWNGAIVPVNE